MNTPHSLGNRDQPGVLAGFGITVVYALTELVRLPLLAVLRIVGPLIRILLGALGFLSLFMAVLFELTNRLPTRSLVALVAFGVLCGLLLLLYEKALSVISR